MSSISRCNNSEAVRELTWENGQISLHGFAPIPQTKQTYDGLDHNNFTLESIVHQATSSFPSSSSAKYHEDGKWSREISDMQVDHNHVLKLNSDFPAAQNMNNNININRSKRERRSDIDEKLEQCGRSNYAGVEESACGSASATFCRDHTDATMMTWPNSLESPRSLKCARTTHHHHHNSLYHDCSENQDGEGTTKGESFRSQSSARRSRAAAIHNQSERRRRDRINEKMKTLQKLVPNASKTDKASMLDEVIEYLKQLQSQVQMMSSARNMPQMMMPMGMQQLQMSMLARMGMGMGMGMLDANNLARNMPHSFPPLLHAPAPAPSFVPQPFPMPPIVPTTAPLKPNFDAASVPNFNDAYNTFLAQQSMNMDFLNKMSAIYRQQSSQQPSKKPVSLSLPNDGRGHGQ